MRSLSVIIILRQFFKYEFLDVGSWQLVVPVPVIFGVGLVVVVAVVRIRVVVVFEVIVPPPVPEPFPPLVPPPVPLPPFLVVVIVVGEDVVASVVVAISWVGHLVVCATVGQVAQVHASVGGKEGGLAGLESSLANKKYFLNKVVSCRSLPIYEDCIGKL